MCVHAEFRSRRVGAELLAEAETFASANGYTSIMAATNPCLAAAPKFYLRNKVKEEQEKEKKKKNRKVAREKRGEGRIG